VSDESSKFQEIQIIREEREKMSKVGQRILTLLDAPKIDTTEVGRCVVELSAHLGNIGGFCDKDSQESIDEMRCWLGLFTNGDVYYALLTQRLPSIIGIQVDWKKKPFKLIGIEFGGSFNRFSAWVKAKFER